MFHLIVLKMLVAVNFLMGLIFKANKNQKHQSHTYCFLKQFELFHWQQFFVSKQNQITLLLDFFFDKEILFIEKFEIKEMTSLLLPYFFVQFPRKLFFFESGKCANFHTVTAICIMAIFYFINLIVVAETIQGRKIFAEIR